MVRVPLHGDAAPVRNQPVVSDPDAAFDFFASPPPSRGLPTPASDAAATLTVVSSPELVNPITAEIVDETSIDDLIDCYEYLDKKDKQIYAAKCRIRQLLLDRTEGDAVSRRVAGKRRKAKVTLPDVGFEQSVLKQLWNDSPELAEQYLKIATIGVQMAAYKKLVNTSSDQADFVAFRDALTAACKGRTGLPTISVEG